MQPYLLEECYEVLDAMTSGDVRAQLEELGDLLFVVMLVADIAGVSIDDVASGISNKMVERHPHVFGDDAQRAAEGGNPGGIAAWEARKKNRSSRLDGVPRTLPALLRAHRQSEKAAAVGFDWADHHGVLAKLQEELGELEVALASGDRAAINHEYGDALLSLANLGRHIGATPEEALRHANDRFAARFGIMEQLASARGVDLATLDDAGLDDLWEKAKATLTDR
jgi:tetrapyrrole methylase family protein/MazG family protein